MAVRVVMPSCPRSLARRSRRPTRMAVATAPPAMPTATAVPTIATSIAMILLSSSGSYIGDCRTVRRVRRSPMWTTLVGDSRVD